MPSRDSCRVQVDSKIVLTDKKINKPIFVQLKLTSSLRDIDLDGPVEELTGGLNLRIVSVHAILLLPAHVALKRLGDKLGVVISFLVVVFQPKQQA